VDNSTFQYDTEISNQEFLQALNNAENPSQSAEINVTSEEKQVETPENKINLQPGTCK